MTERGRGILTEKQREYLELNKAERREEYSRQQRYRLRKNIRQRARDGLLDFDLLFRGLTDDDMAEIFQTEAEQPIVDTEVRASTETEDIEIEGETPAGIASEPPVPEQIRNEAAVIGVRSAIAFLARVENLKGDPIVPGLTSQPALARFRRSVEEGVRRYIAQSHQLSADVSVSINVNDLQPVDEVLERIESEPDVLDLHTLSVLANAGVSGDDLQRLVDRSKNEGK